MECITCIFFIICFSKDEKKIPEEEAENSPGFNPLRCCQGEKLPFYISCHPLRPIVFPVARQKLAVKDISTLSLQSSEILRNTLTSGGRIRLTQPSTVAATSSKTASMSVHVAASSPQPVGVVTSQAQSPGKQFMPVRTPSFNTVSDAALKLPAPVEPNVSFRNPALYVLQKQPRVSYENAFLSHLNKTGVQSGTICQNQAPGQNPSVTVNRHVNGSATTNLKASVPLTYDDIPFRAVLLSPTCNSIAGPAVNKVFLNQNNNSGSVIRTLSPLRMNAAQHLQHIALRNTISSHEPPNLMPLSSFPNTFVPASGPAQFTCPPHPKNADSENVIESKTATLSVSDGGDDDVEVLTNVQDSSAHEVECKWMMESFKRVNCTSRLFLYHLGIFRQKFVKEGSAKGTSHIVGKYYRLLKKLLERLNVQKEYVSKEFSHWLNAEKAKHGIPTTEGGHSSSPPQDKVSDAEFHQEPELLLDMEITCASDHEDDSDPITEVQQNLIECNENLSDSDSDSDDPFSDCESNEQEKVIPALKPILSHTVREVLRDKCTRKLFFQLLRGCDSKTANMKRKIISSAEAVQSIDGKEAPSVKEKEGDISKLKTCVSTGVQTEVCVSTGVQTEAISANCSEFSFLAPEPIPCSGIEKGKSVGTEVIDSNGKAVQGSQMGTSSSGTEGRAGSGGERSISPCMSNVAVCVDTNSDVQDSKMATASSGTEGETMNAECDMSNQKYQGTKRKSHSVLCTVTPHLETKRLHTRRSASLFPSTLQRTANPGTDFTTLFHSAVQKKLIKPCCVSVVRLNRTNECRNAP